MKFFKKLTALFLACILCIGATAFAQNSKVTVELNGEPIVFDVEPKIVNDRTMVPLRAIAEALDAFVFWNETDRSVLFSKGDMVAMLQIGNPKLFLNNDSLELDSPPVIVSDRTLVPLSVISESFGATVAWDDATKTVSITMDK